MALCWYQSSNFSTLLFKQKTGWQPTGKINYQYHPLVFYNTHSFLICPNIISDLICLISYWPFTEWKTTILDSSVGAVTEWLPLIYICCPMYLCIFGSCIFTVILAQYAYRVFCISFLECIWVVWDDPHCICTHGILLYIMNILWSWNVFGYYVVTWNCICPLNVLGYLWRIAQLPNGLPYGSHKYIPIRSHRHETACRRSKYTSLFDDG